MNKPLHLLFRIPPSLSHRTIPRLTAKYRPLQAVQARTMTSPPQKQQHPPTQPRFSQGSDAAASEKTLSALLASDGSGGRWTLTADGEGVERMFRFKTFAKTWVCLLFAPIFVRPLVVVTSWVVVLPFFGMVGRWAGGGDTGRRWLSPSYVACPLFFVDKSYNSYIHKSLTQSFVARIS